MVKTFLSALVVLACSFVSAAPEDAYHAALDRLNAGDNAGAITSATEALATTEPGPQAIERATALELIGRYEVRTNRIDLGVRHLSEALALMSTTFNAHHPRVVSVKKQLIEAERKRF